MLIESFLDNRNENTMILPKVSSEVGIFYQLLLEEISKRKNILCKKIYSYKNINDLITPSLFEEKKNYIFDVEIIKSDLEDLSTLEDKSQKFFVFLNYATYKKNTLQLPRINAYDYKKDILSFIKEDENFRSLDSEMKTEFLNFSYDNPHLFFSEYQKLDIHALILDRTKNHESDTILSVRKDIFKYRNEFTIKILPKFYSLLKKEVIIKKFNF